MANIVKTEVRVELTAWQLEKIESSEAATVDGMFGEAGLRPNLRVIPSPVDFVFIIEQTICEDCNLRTNHELREGDWLYENVSQHSSMRVVTNEDFQRLQAAQK